MIESLFQRGVWLVPAVLLFVAAWVKFNRPPTNRSGTTFFLFHCGVAYYYALTILIWLLTIMMVKGGSKTLGPLGFSASTEDMAMTAPLVAALFIVVVSQIPRIRQLDNAARSFCMRLAAIPRQADQLALNLAFRAAVEAKPELTRIVKKELVDNAGVKSVDFDMNNGTPQARFTRAMFLYWLFVIPYLQGTALSFTRSKHGREAYAAVLSTNGPLIKQAKAQYQRTLEAGASYFTSLKPSHQTAETLDQAIQDLSIPVCSLIARYVLLVDATPRGRQMRLASMGFDAADTESRYGRDQFAASIFALAVVFLVLSLQFPGSASLQTFADKIQLAIVVAIQLATAMFAGSLVAQRFQERREGTELTFPPVWELLLAAIIVVVFCISFRILFDFLVRFLLYSALDWQLSVDKFRRAWQWIVLPFICTISIGLICSYLGSLAWGKLKLALVGGFLNACAFALGGFVVTRLQELDDDRRPLIIAFTMVLGACSGMLAPVLFASSRRSTQAAARLAAIGEAGGGQIGYPAGAALTPAYEILPAGDAKRAPMELGGYFRSGVEGLEGEYVCFRPTFSDPKIINAYLISIRWDEEGSCLVFEEQRRSDQSYSQAGRVYIPENKQFMHLVTVDRGAVRIIMVTKPDGSGLGRGLVMTLANPTPLHFIPATSPIVLRRLSGEAPQLGFVHDASPDYGSYMSEIKSVFPDFGIPVRPAI